MFIFNPYGQLAPLQVKPEGSHMPSTWAPTASIYLLLPIDLIHM